MTPDLTPEDLASAERELNRLLTGKDADAELAKDKKLQQLAPLGFKDYGDGEMPDAIYHDLTGPINHGSVRLDNVLAIVFKAGQERGMDELRAQFRALLDVAPASPTD